MAEKFGLSFGPVSSLTFFSMDVSFVPFEEDIFLNQMSDKQSGLSKK
jgi:hypothetical protein